MRVGEVIDHVDGVTIEEAEHMMATRLWQNTSKTHFDATPREDRKRLIYGGHVMSMARALSFNGLANAQCIVAINAGSTPIPALPATRCGRGPKCSTPPETPAPGVGAIRSAAGGDEGRRSRSGH
jgi:2-methylfumaryl-CoA hydratase